MSFIWHGFLIYLGDIMKKVYNIVDQNILIDTDFDYKMDDAYNPFLECDSTYDVKYKFNKINKLDNNLFLKNKKYILFVFLLQQMIYVLF